MFLYPIFIYFKVFSVFMIKIMAVGKIKERWIKEGIEMFTERLWKLYRVDVVEIKEENMISRIKDRDYVVVCDEMGEEMGSEEFAGFLKRKIEDDVVFVIGGVEGLSEEIKERANKVLSMSKMTFTHEMARLFLIEQVYRAFTIMKGVRYHK